MEERRSALPLLRFTLYRFQAEALAEPEQGPSPETLLWRAVLDDLALQMTRATFEKWLKGSTLERAGEGYVVRARDQYGVEWLEHRLGRMIGRMMARHAGPGVVVQFAAQPPD